jgi:myosin-5
MTTAYAKGTQVWYPDSTLAWVPATVTSITLPSDEAPTSLVELTIAFDENTSNADAGDSKVLKLPLSALESAEGGGGVNGVQGSTAAPGQDALPPLRNPPLLESAEDLASLSNLNEPSGEFIRRTMPDGALIYSLTCYQDAIRDACPVHLLWYSPGKSTPLLIVKHF